MDTTTTPDLDDIAEVEFYKSEAAKYKADFQNAFDDLQRERRAHATAIGNLKGYLVDYYDMNGHLLEELEEIAELMDIEMTKRIKGTGTITFEYDMEVPLNFDNYDLDFDIEINAVNPEVGDESVEVTSQDWDTEDDD